MLLKEGIEKKLLQKLTNKKTRVNLQNPQPGLWDWDNLIVSKPK